MVEGAHQSARDILEERSDDLERISEILLARETIDAEQFVALLEGTPEEEVFPPVEESEDEEEAELTTEPEPVHHPGSDTSKAPPRPGYAGGMSETRSD